MGLEFFEPSPSTVELQPTLPFPRNDLDDVGKARQSPPATLPDLDKPKAARLALGVLDAGAADAGERGYGVDRQRADPAPLTLASDDARAPPARRVVNRAAIGAGTAPLMAWRRRRSRLACLSGERGVGLRRALRPIDDDRAVCVPPGGEGRPTGL